MHVLVVSNLYPPHFIGGYELGCRDVAEGLRRRGHRVSVLTSTYVAAQDKGRSVHERIPTDADGVERRLRIEPFTPGWAPRRLAVKPMVFRHNYARTRDLIERLAPDVLYQWSPNYISLAPAFAATDAGLPVRFFVSDDWMQNWERWPHPVLRRWGESLAALTGLSRSLGSIEVGGAVHFASRYLREATARCGFDVAGSPVIHWGVDADVFRFDRARSGEPRRVLYVGQLGPHKGVHTAILAFQRVSARIPGLSLTVAGGSMFPAYERSLRSLARGDARIRFTGKLSREELPALYAEHDVLLFPSVWQEPFSLTVLEAMACGAVVVGTDTGGSGEVLHDGVTGLLFEPGDDRGCAAALERALGDETLVERLRSAARGEIETRFSLPVMLDRIETAL